MAKERKVLSLEGLEYGSITARAPKCEIPGSKRLKHTGFEEVYVPAVRSAAKGEKLEPISSLPGWA